MKTNRSTKTGSGTRSVSESKPTPTQNEQEVTVITEGKGTRIVTYVSDYQGKSYFNIRKQFRKEGADWLFSKDGIAIPLERSNLVKISRAMKAAAADLE